MKNGRQFALRLFALAATCAARSRSESGDAIVELALTVALLGMPLLLGIISFAPAIYSSIEVANAAHAGVMYGMTSGTRASDSANIKTAAQTEAPDFGANLTVTPTLYWVCALSQGGTQYATQAAATSACTSSGDHAVEYLKVTATAIYTSALHLPGFSSTIPLSSTSAMEVEE
jgi:Flp pilus assembly protein TadG